MDWNLWNRWLLKHFDRSWMRILKRINVLLCLIENPAVKAADPRKPRKTKWLLQKTERNQMQTKVQSTKYKVQSSSTIVDSDTRADARDDLTTTIVFEEFRGRIGKLSETGKKELPVSGQVGQQPHESGGSVKQRQLLRLKGGRQARCAWFRPADGKLHLRSENLLQRPAGGTERLAGFRG